MTPFEQFAALVTTMLARSDATHGADESKGARRSFGSTSLKAGGKIGEFMGMPPKRRRYTIGEIHVFRVTEGRIVEHWHQMDAMSMMAQLKDSEPQGPV